MKPVLAEGYDRSIILWSWLFPLNYVIHIAEEFWGGEGYPAYIFRLRGVYMSQTRFLVAQGVGFVLLTIGVILARRFRFLPTMLVILGTTAAVNSLYIRSRRSARLSMGQVCIRRFFSGDHWV